MSTVLNQLLIEDPVQHTNLSILAQTIARSASQSKLWFFPVVMYGCKSWSIKKAECQRIDAFELWCWRSLLRVSWIARRSNQSILKEINSVYSLEGVMLKLRNFGYLMWRADSLEKTLMQGMTEGRRRREWQRMRWLDASRTQWTWVWVNSRIWWWTGRPDVLQTMGLQKVGHVWVTELNWTDHVILFIYLFFPILVYLSFIC